MKKFKFKRLIIITGLIMIILIIGTSGAMASSTLDNTTIGVSYRGHVQNYGNLPKPEGTMVAGADAFGTRGQSLRLEGFWINLTGDVPEEANIVYEVHVQDEGWIAPAKNGSFAGTEGKSERIEAIKIHLENLPGYDVYYCGHVENVGDIPQINGDWGWVKNNEQLGTTGSGLRLEEIRIKIVKRPDIRYEKAGTYGPESGNQIIDNNVVVNAPDVVLQNLHITGDLTIGEGVEEGNVTLNNVVVEGNTFINGGGKNSIHINGGQYKKVIVQQTSSAQVRIVAVDVNGLEVVISDDAKGEEIILEGIFDTVQVDAPDAEISTQSDTCINKLTMGAKAINSQLRVGSQTSIEHMVLNVKTDIKGQGTINNMDVNVDRVTYEKAPLKENIATNVKIPPSVIPPASPTPTPTPTPTPGSSGGGSGASSTPVTAVAITGVSNVGSTLTANTTPNEANCTFQWLRSTAVDGDYTSISGATDKNYPLTSQDESKYIKVSATGTGSYTGASLSNTTAIVTAFKEISGFSALSDINLDSNENITDLATLKTSGILPMTVTVTDGTAPADAVITNWTGTFDGTTTGTKNLTAIWSMPTGYWDEVSPITVPVKVNVNTAQSTLPMLSSEKIIVSTSIGTVSDGNITKVPMGTKVSALKSALVVSADASVEIIDGTGGSPVINPDIADVTTSMKIKITAQDTSSSEYTITIALDLTAPSNVTATAGDLAINLSWDPVPNAESYQIYQSTTSHTGFSEIATTPSPCKSTSYLINGLIAGQTYYFEVKALASDYNASVFSQEVTAIASVDNIGTEYVGNKLVVSNESLDISSAQSTGSLSANMILTEQGLDADSYRLNPELPFTPAPENQPVSSDMIPCLSIAEVNDTRLFYTYNYQEPSYEQVTGRCAYIGNHVEIWVENTMGATVAEQNANAQALAIAFDDTVYPIVTSNFYSAPDVNGDGRIAILCYDIKDGYNGHGYVGGYYWGGDQYTGVYSNQMDIIYVDSYPLMGSTQGNPTDISKAFSTMAHEFQHMVNYNCKQMVQGNHQMETWMNEGLSMAAEQMCYGTQTNRISYFNTSTAIANGRSLLEWNNADPLPNYSLSYLFSQYLRTQAKEKGSPNIFGELIADTNTNVNTSLEKVIHKDIDPAISLGAFMTNFRVALLVKANGGKYGFDGEAAFNTVTPMTYSGSTADLKGGGAVVKSITTPFLEPALHGANISYTGVYKR